MCAPMNRIKRRPESVSTNKLTRREMVDWELEAVLRTNITLYLVNNYYCCVVAKPNAYARRWPVKKKRAPVKRAVLQTKL